MSLRIRRGTNADRLTITPDEGELIYVNTGTNARKLYIGDGQTVGGRNIGEALAGNNLVWDNISQTLQAVAGGGSALPPNALGYLRNNGTGSLSWTASAGGIATVSADTTPSLGGNLNTGSFNIAGAGNISTSAGSFTTSTLQIVGSQITGTAPPPTTVGYTVESPISFGTNTVPNTLFVRSTSTLMQLTGITTALETSGLVSRMSRGTLAIPTAVQPGDGLFYQQGMGFDGTNFQIAGGYGVSADRFATVTAGRVPGSFVAYSISSDGNPNYLEFDSKGTLRIPNLLISGLTYFDPNYITVATTATYTLSLTKSVNILLVGTTGLTATINMPTSPVDGQVCSLTVASNSVTLALGTGTVIPAFAGVQSSGYTIRYVYRATGTTWYRI
jgi:hypothetical protein